MSIIAFDVDLLRIHAWSTETRRVCYEAPDFPFDELVKHDRILMEVASPNFYDKRPSVVYNTMKWACFNMTMLGRLARWLEERGQLDKLLVAPSSAWSCGHEEAVRQEMAGCTGQDNHDLRETRAMIWFYKRAPGKWVPYHDYLRSLSTAAPKKPKKPKQKKGQTP
jgi:hypothetical protein